jgi:hypothetical protein
MAQWYNWATGLSLPAEAAAQAGATSFLPSRTNPNRKKDFRFYPCPSGQADRAGRILTDISILIFNPPSIFSISQ